MDEKEEAELLEKAMAYDRIVDVLRLTEYPEDGLGTMTRALFRLATILARVEDVAAQRDAVQRRLDRLCKHLKKIGDAAGCVWVYPAGQTELSPEVLADVLLFRTQTIASRRADAEADAGAAREQAKTNYERNAGLVAENARLTTELASALRKLKTAEKKEAK
jgi:hypothetical protein